MENEKKEIWSRGYLETIDACPTCRESYYILNKYSRQSEVKGIPDIWNISLCLNCDSLFLNPRPDSTSLTLAYSDYYTHSTDEEYISPKLISRLLWHLIYGYLNKRFGMNRKPSYSVGYFLFFSLNIFRYKLDYYGRHLFLASKKGHLLDIGCGNGEFLLRAKEMGWQVTGCEPDPRAAKECVSKGIEIFDDIFSPHLDNMQFEAITMRHVIEHVYDPLSLLKRAHSLLKPDGFLWLALPNPQSLSLKTFSQAWLHLHPPFHLCIPSQKQLICLLREANFKKIDFKKRGMHIKNYCNLSYEIAKKEKTLSVKQRLFMLFRFYYIIDFISTYSIQYADETVITAIK